MHKKNMWHITRTRMVSKTVSHCTLSLYLIYDKMDGYVKIYLFCNILFIFDLEIRFTKKRAHYKNT